MHLDLMNKALFRKSDLFSKIREEEKFDMIVSNPPYIPPHEKENLQIEVRKYEPYNALFTSDEKGLEFYKKITEQAYDYLNKEGFLIFESGAGQAQDIAEIITENKFKDIQILKDVSGTERVVCAHL